MRRLNLFITVVTMVSVFLLLFGCQKDNIEEIEKYKNNLSELEKKFFNLNNDFKINKRSLRDENSTTFIYDKNLIKLFN